VQWGAFWWDRRDDGAVLRWNEETQTWDEWRPGDSGVPPSQFADASQGGAGSKARDLLGKGREVVGSAVAAQQASREQQAAIDQQSHAAVASQQHAQSILFACQSHESGRNSRVILFPDRIERVKERSRASISRARQDTEVTPIRSVSSVQANKDGVLYTKVTVFASGNTIEFRIHHDDAQRFKDAVMQLVLNPPVQEQAPASGPLPAVTPQEADPLDQLKKLGELRESGLDHTRGVRGQEEAASGPLTSLRVEGVRRSRHFV
jgi:hypothetical protein